MIHHKCIQGSEDWLRLRLGRPTASEFERIITPAERRTKEGEIKGWQPTKSETRRAYQIKLLTELILGVSLDNVVTPAMLHGKDWEPKARSAYELEENTDVEICGFCTLDDGSAGASPDGFVGQDGSIEIKCPERPEVHMGYFMDAEAFIAEHWAQVQGQLYITGRKWTDLISYFMGLPMATVRITPHPEFQKRLHSALQTFLAEFRDLRELAVNRGVKFPSRADKPAQELGRDWFTQDDVDAVESILEAQRRERIEVK